MVVFTSSLDRVNIVCLKSCPMQVRSLAMGVTAAIVSAGFNSPEYGGSFAWSFTVPQFLLVLTALVVIGLYPIVCLADAKVDTYKSYVQHFRDLIGVFELDGIWRVAFALFGCA
jgi:hypothetical protein